MNKIYKVEIYKEIKPKYVVCESTRDIYNLLSQYYDYFFEDKDILSIELIADEVLLESDFK